MGTCALLVPPMISMVSVARADGTSSPPMARPPTRRRRVRSNVDAFGMSDMAWDYTGASVGSIGFSR